MKPDEVLARVLTNARPGLVRLARRRLPGTVSGARETSEDVVEVVLIRTLRLADKLGWTQLAREALDEANGDEVEAARCFPNKLLSAGSNMDAYLLTAVRNEAQERAQEAWSRHIELLPLGMNDGDERDDDAYLARLSPGRTYQDEEEEQALVRVLFEDWTRLSAQVIALARWALVLLGRPEVSDRLLAQRKNVDTPEWLVDWSTARGFLLRYVDYCLDSHWYGPERTYEEAKPGWTPVRQLAYLLLVVDAARSRVAGNSAHLAATRAEINGVPVAELVDAYETGPALLQRIAAHTLQSYDYANPNGPRPPALVARQSTHEPRRAVCSYLAGSR